METINFCYKQLTQSRLGQTKYLKYIAIGCGFIGIRYIAYKLYNKLRSYPDGPVGLPIFGCFLSFASNPKQFLFNISTYGPITFVPLMFTNNLFISDPKILSQLFKQKAITDRSHLRNLARPTANFVTLSGAKWKQRRKHVSMTVTNLMNSTFIMERSRECIDKYVIPLIDDKHINQKQLFFPIHYMKYIAFNNIWSAVFDIVIPLSDPFIEQYLNITDQVFVNASIPLILDMMFGKSVKIQDWILSKTLWKADKFCDNLLVNWLNKSGEFTIDFKRNIFHRNTLKKREDTSRIKSKVYVDYLIEKHAQKEMTMEDMISDIQIVIQAAVDTTATNAEYGIILLAKYPEIQEIVYNELISVMNENNFQEFDLKIINKLHIFRAFIHEVLRICCVGPLGVPHMTDRDYTVELEDGKVFNIPKDTYLHMNNWYMMKYMDWNEKDKALTKENSEIHLEYWLDSKSKKFKMNENFTLFGIGRRDCVGRALAMRSLYVEFGLLMTKYKFVAANNDPNAINIRQKFAHVLSIEPKIGIQIQRR